jgi:hypothetical protein
LLPRTARQQGRSGLGLAAQRHDIAAFALREGFAVRPWHQDVQTGAGADALLLRPGLEDYNQVRAFRHFANCFPSTIRPVPLVWARLLLTVVGYALQLLVSNAPLIRETPRRACIQVRGTPVIGHVVQTRTGTGCQQENERNDGCDSHAGHTTLPL